MYGLPMDGRATLQQSTGWDRMHGDPNQSYRPRLVCARGRYYDHTVVFNYSVHGVADAVAARACQWRASEEKPVRRRQKGGVAVWRWRSQSAGSPFRRGSDNLRSPVNRGSLRSIRSHAPHGQFLCSVRPIALHVELICPIPLVYRELYPHVMSPYLIPKKKLL